MVNTKTGKTFAGVLWAKRGGLLIMKEATLLPEVPQGQPAKIDGELLIERSNVDFIQIFSSSEG